MRVGVLSSEHTAEPHAVDDRAAQLARLELVRPGVSTAATLAHERTLPVLGGLRELVPSGVLQRGSTLAAHGPGATSFTLAMSAEAVRAGSFLAIVAPPTFGLGACLDFDIPLRRVVQFAIPESSSPPGDGAGWAQLIAAIVEGFDLVVLADRHRVTASQARQLVARNRERGSVLLRAGGRPWPDAPDLRYDLHEPQWNGLGHGHGHLRSRRLAVHAAGRRWHGSSRVRHLLLPGDDGVEVVEPTIVTRSATVTPLRSPATPTGSAIPDPTRRGAARFAGADIDELLDAVDTDPADPDVHRGGARWPTPVGPVVAGSAPSPEAASMTAAVTAERITVVSCRSWPIVGCGYRLDDVAVVVVGNRVVATSSVAHQLGVANGVRRREAQRRAPDVEVLAPDPAGEARAFEPVLRALEDLTPRIEIDRPGRCSFLTRGPSRYFGGDQAMSRRVAEFVAEVLEGRTTVHVGTADSRFAAIRAAAIAEADDARVVPPGASAAFLSPLPVPLLAADVAPGPLRTELDDLVDVLARLGLTTMGAFAALTTADVVARFGAVGVLAHRWAQGLDHHPAAPEDPPDDLEVAVELDPPVERVDQAAFVARTLAEDFIRTLRVRGVSCARVEIIAETEHGEEQHRLWRSEEAFSATAISDRMRWQLDGWLSGPIRQRPTGGLSRLALRPDDLSVAAGRQLGFWGEQTGLAERAARSVARIQGLAGVGVAMVPELRGSRSPGDEVVAVPAESVDLVERAAVVDRTLFDGASGDPAAGAMGEHARRPWAGSLPPPRPSTVHAPPIVVELLDEGLEPVTVSARGLMTRLPAQLRVGGGRPVEVVGWSGPWLLDERWWQPDQRRRAARMQAVLADGRAVLLATRSGSWVVEASYD